MWQLAAVITGLTVGPPAGVPCSIVSDGSEYLRESESSWVVAQVLPDTARAALHPEGAVAVRGEPLGHLIEIAEGVGHELDGVAAPGTRVAVFIWSLGADCGWYNRADLRPGTRHHFNMRLRPDSMWADGIPTFDVSPTSGFHVFPAHMTIQDADWQNYMELVDLVPSRSEWAPDCRPFLEPLREWHDRNQGGYWTGTVSRLWRACEQMVRGKAGALERQNGEPVPESVLTWSRAAGCDIRSRWDETFDAIEGTFHEGSARRSWAVLCETATRTRLVVIDEESGELDGELMSIAGKLPNWSFSVVPPEYFDWKQFGESFENREGVDPPRADGVILRAQDIRGHGWMNFANLGGTWVGYPAWQNQIGLRMPSLNE